MNDKNHIIVTAQPQFIAEQSDVQKQRYVFAYTITITNAGCNTAQLLTRHWLITDGNGNMQEVHGDGVVGKQPTLKPGATFRYTSGTVLDTVVGVMRGSYTLRADDGEEFDAPIPQFTLAIPRVLH